MVWWESSYSAHSGDPGLVNTTLQERLHLPESFRAGCGSWNTLEVEDPFPQFQKQLAPLHLCFVLWDVHHKVSMLFFN